MAIVFESWVLEHAQRASDFQIHPKKHLLDPRAGLPQQVDDLLRVAHWLGVTAPLVYSP